jgi:hypothetical protein
MAIPIDDLAIRRKVLTTTALAWGLAPRQSQAVIDRDTRRRALGSQRPSTARPMARPRPTATWMLIAD